MNVYYIWNLKPNESNNLPPLKYIKHNSRYIENSYLFLTTRLFGCCHLPLPGPRL